MPKCAVHELQGPLTIELCNALCLHDKKHAEKKFKYFGVQAGGSGCFCGDAFGMFGQAKADSDCSLPCAGNSSEICGGDFFNSVYEIEKMGQHL